MAFDKSTTVLLYECTSNLVIHYYSSGSPPPPHTNSKYVKRMLEFLFTYIPVYALPSLPSSKKHFFATTPLLQQQKTNKATSPSPPSSPTGPDICQFCNSKQTPKYVIFWPSTLKRPPDVSKKNYFMKQHTQKTTVVVFSFISFFFSIQPPQNVELDTMFPTLPEKNMNWPPPPLKG